MLYRFAFIYLLSLSAHASADSLTEDDREFWGRQLEDETSLGDAPTESPVVTSTPTASPEPRSPKSPPGTPTSSPTAVPTLTQVQAIVDLTFNVIFAIQGLSVLQVPTNDNLAPFLQAVSNPLTEVFVPGNVTVNVVNVGGLGIGRRLRRLEDTVPSIEIESTVLVRRNCFRPVCDEEAAQLYLHLYKQGLAEVAQSGDLTQAIREEAIRLDVAVLRESTVAPTSCRLVSSSFEITPVDDNNNDDAVNDDDETTSSGIMISLKTTTILGLALLSWMVMG